MLIIGSCHCRNIVFELDWPGEPEQIPARACTCSFCTKHGGVWTSCPAGSLNVIVRDAAQISRYRFGTETADFHVCSRCGVVPLVTSEIDGIVYAVVSVGAFEDFDRLRLRISSSSVDDESEPERLARRKRNWIGHVTFAAAADDAA